MSKAGTLIGRRYGGFRGVDFRGEEVNISRSPDSMNMWRDYENPEGITTRPSIEPISKTEGTVYGVFFYNGKTILHIGEKLYAGNIYTDSYDNKKEIYSNLVKGKSHFFNYGGKLYIKDGAKYICYDGNNAREVEGYVPTTSIGRNPGGGGTTYEDVNMLSSYRKNSFLADGESTVYHLDSTDIDSDSVPQVTINGSACVNSAYKVDYKNGTITFTFTPEKPSTDGQDNVVIQFKKTVEGHRETIEKCTIAQVFDNRVFFSGNPDKPNFLWHSSLDDPTYVSDLDYYQDGMDNAAIKAMVAGNNALSVFREPKANDTSVFYHTPTIDAEYGKIYPSRHSSISLGCKGGAINFNDDIVFLSTRGLEGVTGDVETEQFASHRSSLVDAKLNEWNTLNMCLEEWEGYLLIMSGRNIYLADSRSKFQNGDHFEYEWFYWIIDQNIISSCSSLGALWLGTNNGLYLLQKAYYHENPVRSYWVTPKDKFDNPNKLKTSHKRGCVVEAKGDVEVYAKVEDSDFEHIGTYEGVEDYFVSRIKRKKFKDIQLKFSSDTRFSLETATLEAFVGGYIKR